MDRLGMFGNVVEYLFLAYFAIILYLHISFVVF